MSGLYSKTGRKTFPSRFFILLKGLKSLYTVKSDNLKMWEYCT